MPSKLDLDRDAPQHNAFREFTPWCPWAERTGLVDTVWNEYPITSFAGVYVLAHFDHVPTGLADFTDPSIIYVGEGGKLGRRWYNFERSAYHKKPGHSGGHTYFREFERRQWQRLHVAALPIWFGDGDESLEPWTRNFRHAAERVILWMITVERGGEGTLLNRK